MLVVGDVLVLSAEVVVFVLLLKVVVTAELLEAVVVVAFPLQSPVDSVNTPDAP